MQQALDDEHSSIMPRWVKSINALALPFRQLPSSCQSGSVHLIIPDDGPGPWTIHLDYSVYEPVGCMNASCEPIAIALSFKVIHVKPP